MRNRHYEELSQHGGEKGTVFEGNKGIIGSNGLVPATNEFVRCVINDQRMCKKITAK